MLLTLVKPVEKKNKTNWRKMVARGQDRSEGYRRWIEEGLGRDEHN
jgi:hypothetical protein